MNFKRYAGILGLSLLAGCAGPEISRTPVGHVCRSCQPYEIDGVMYYPQTHYDYKEEGIASWYGPGFHGRPKAYGEKYDQEGISAAHKTLPLPSVVKVTNIKTGKSMKVVVDDRGPYVGDRIIDLSKGAARMLDVHHAGTAQVEVEALVEESKALSKYLGRFGRTGIDPSGRTWHAIYQEEIAPHFDEHGQGGSSHHHTHSEEAFLEPVYKAQEIPHQAKESFNQIINTVAVEEKKPLDQLFETVGYEKEKLPVKKGKNLPKSKFGAKPLQKGVSKDYFIEVGDYIKEGNAKNVLAELRPISRGQVKPYMAAKKQRLYSVKLGPFRTLKQAKAAHKNVVAVGYEQARVDPS